MVTLSFRSRSLRYIILSEVVVGVISAGILTDETFGWREVVGSTMIVLGGVLAVVLAPKDEK